MRALIFNYLPCAGGHTQLVDAHLSKASLFCYLSPPPSHLLSKYPQTIKALPKTIHVGIIEGGDPVLGPGGKTVLDILASKFSFFRRHYDLLLKAPWARYLCGPSMRENTRKFP